MPWKCPQCGVNNTDDTKRTCEACSFTEFGTLVLVAAATTKELKTNIDLVAGKNLLKTFAGDEARFASEPQFKLTRDATLGGWAIQAVTGATNPTFYNGAALPETAVKLADGGVISIGPEKLKLTVKLGL